MHPSPDAIHHLTRDTAHTTGIASESLDGEVVPVLPAAALQSAEQVYGQLNWLLTRWLLQFRIVVKERQP